MVSFDKPKFDEKRVIENIGLGKGHLSTVSLVRNEETGEEFVVKIPIIEHSKILAAPIKSERFQMMHNSEVDIYRILCKHADAQIAHPKIFYLEKMCISKTPIQHGMIAMEHLRHCDHVLLSDNLRPEELIEPLRNLARLHALSLKLSDEERAIISKDLIKEWFGELFCAPNLHQFMGVLTNNSPQFFTHPEFLRLLPEVLSPENLAKFNDDCEIAGIRPVVSHGDYWTSNLLFRVSSNGIREFQAVCDFQTANWGNAAQDLTRLFVTGLSGKDRRDHYQSLLRIYYEELVSTCSPSDAPFSFEQLESSYTRFFPLHAAIMCVATPGRQLIRIAETTNEDRRDQMRLIILEKYSCLLEDLAQIWIGKRSVNQEMIR